MKPKKTITRLEQVQKMLLALGYYATITKLPLSEPTLHVWHIKKHVTIVVVKDFLAANHMRKFDVRLHTELGVVVKDIQ